MGSSNVGWIGKQCECTVPDDGEGDEIHAAVKKENEQLKRAAEGAKTEEAVEGEEGKPSVDERISKKLATLRALQASNDDEDKAAGYD